MNSTQGVSPYKSMIHNGVDKIDYILDQQSNISKTPTLEDISGILLSSKHSGGRYLSKTKIVA